MFSVAVRVPLAVGLKITLILHAPTGATLVPQVPFCEKSPACGPVIVMPVSLSDVLLTFTRLTFWGAVLMPTV